MSGNDSLGKRKVLSLLAIALLLAISPFKAKAQINIFGNQTAIALAQKLAGPGIIITNTKLTCAGTANGIFVAQSTNLGIDSGIILTTGRAESITGSLGANGTSSIASVVSSNNATPGDAYLDNYIGSQTFDACTLEFDFTAAGDTVKFDYAFGSEEYPGYSCSNYNDVFGFFISGPNITGIQNLAVIPGTTIRVAINSTTDTIVNHPASCCGLCTAMGPGSPFGQYYVGARTGATYDGFTTIFRAIQRVLPCSTYHLKLVVADVTDPALDSGVWLKAGSLSSNTATIASKAAGASSGSTPYVVRGCNNGTFTFTRQDPLPTPLVVHFQIGGSAINGQDYITIADSVTIPAFSTTANLTISPIVVSPKVGLKLIKLYLLGPNCNIFGPPPIVDSAVIEEYDELKLKMITPDTSICAGDQILITAEADPDYTFSWTPGKGVFQPKSLSTVIKPDTTTTYTLTASFPTCVDVKQNITIEVQPLPIVDAGKDTAICKWDSAMLHVTVKPTWYKDYSYSWSPGTDLNRTDSNYVVQLGVTDATLKVLVKTTAGCIDSDEVSVTIHPIDFAKGPDTTIGTCPLDSVSIYVTGGVKYMWEPANYLNKTTGDVVRSSPPGPITYTVYAIDQYTCKDTITIPVTPYPGAIVYLGEDVHLHHGERYQMDAKGNCTQFVWFPHVGLSATNIPNPMAQPLVNTRYYVTGITDKGCSMTDIVDVYMDETIMDIPNAFTPLGLNNELKIVVRGIATLKYFRIFNRWGEKVFETSDINKGWDGRYQGMDQPVGTYIYTIEAETDGGQPFKKQGNVTLIR